MRSKSQTRKDGIAARRALSPSERKTFSEEICRKISEDPAFRKASNILIYKARKEEADPEPLCSMPGSEGKRFFYPRVDGNDMMILSPSSPDAWTKGSFGILEPDPDQSVQAEPSSLDMVICPCTSFDEQCRRMGMGGGYYDRFLPGCPRAYIVAVAFECQKTDEVPCEPTDIGMGAVFTEKAVYTPKGE